MKRIEPTPLPLPPAPPPVTARPPNPWAELSRQRSDENRRAPPECVSFPLYFGFGWCEARVCVAEFDGLRIALFRQCRQCRQCRHIPPTDTINLKNFTPTRHYEILRRIFELPPATLRFYSILLLSLLLRLLLFLWVSLCFGITTIDHFVPRNHSIATNRTMYNVPKWLGMEWRINK